MVQCKFILDNGSECKKENSCWNFPDLPPRFCNEHADKKNGMIDVKNKKCIHITDNKKCSKRASFGFPGGNALYCAPCGKNISPLIIQIYKKYCKHAGCNHIPLFNYENEPLGKFCFKHKELNMINVKGKRCPIEGCNSLNPPYDFPGGTGTFCYKHYEKGMINIRTIRCIVCKTITASYGFPNEKATHCNTDKLDKMIFTKKNKCDDCDTESLYGLPFNSVSKCFKHREKGMIKRSNAKCQTCNVNISTHGFNFTAFRCEICKLESDENLSERKCKSCGLMMVLNKDEICEFCDPEIFLKYFLAKQNALKQALEISGLIFTSVDKTIDKGICGKERPDFVLDLNKFIIIIECDENQHKDRFKDCEITRMINISQSYGGTPIYFIRFNPDNYKPKDNNYIVPINTRYKILINFIKSIQDGTHQLPKDSLVNVIYMYYDGWNNLEEAKWESIQKFEND